MKNYLVLTFFIVSGYWQIVHSANTQINLENTKTIRSYLNKLVESSPRNYVRGIPIDNFGGDTRVYENVYEVDEAVDETDYVNNDKGIFEKNGLKFDLDAGNPDFHSEVERPCQAYDTFCIRKFFSEHSHCKISGKAVPDPLYRAQASMYYLANMTKTMVNSAYSGLNNARVVEFYINKLTNNLVIAITFDSASMSSNITYLKYYLRGREPVVLRDFHTLQYGVLTVTVIIPHIDDLRLDRAEIYTYGDTNVYPFFIGPGVALSADPEVPAMFATFVANTPKEYIEEISTQGSFMAGNYIQYNICDFGIKFL